MRGKKNLLKKEEEKNEEKNNMKKRIKAFEDNFISKEKNPFNKF